MNASYFIQLQLSVLVDVKVVLLFLNDMVKVAKISLFSKSIFYFYKTYYFLETYHIINICFLQLSEYYKYIVLRNGTVGIFGYLSEVHVQLLISNYFFIFSRVFLY